MNSDALSASPRFRMITCDGVTTTNLLSLGDGCCRAIKLLSTATGDLTLTPASPITGSATEAITITNLAAGDVLNVQASAVLGPNGLKIAVFW